MLASQGFAVLALAYFGLEHLPRTLENIPLEYCETAIQWLQNHPSIDAERIGLWGTSRGAELALLLGATWPGAMRAIAAHAPSSVIYSNLSHPELPAWTYRSAPLAPHAPCPAFAFAPHAGTTPDRAIALTPFFLQGMRDEPAFLAARTPVEKITCPVLLASGKDDRMWPADLYARQIAERIKTPCTHLSYPGAGHHICLSWPPKEGTVDFHPIVKMWFDFGGNPQDNRSAQTDSWQKTLTFFSSQLLNAL
jgi:dienelactone hydrolase